MKYLFIICVLLIIHCSLLIVNAQWQPDVRLTNDPALSELVNGNSWAIKANGNILHVVWRDNRTGSGIYYKRSTDGGTSWGADIRLTDINSISLSSSIAISGTTAHVIWTDYRNGNGNLEIYYKRSSDAGISWGQDTRLTNDTSVSQNASISVSGSVVHVVWEDYRDYTYENPEIYYKRSTDGGITWEADRRLTIEPLGKSKPSVAVNGSIVHIVWSDLRDGTINGNTEIYYKRSTDGGSTWSADTRLTNDFSISELPSISVSSSTISVVWGDFRNGNYEIYYKRSTDDGLSWETDRRLTNNDAYSNFANVTASGSVVHVVWRDERDGNREIYYKRSTDFGSNWDADFRLTNNTAISDAASIAASGSVVHIVWQDNRDGNYEIYYKRDPTGNGIHTISGQIRFQDNNQPVTSGIVKAIHYDRITNQVITFDSTSIQSNGDYTLTHIPQDSTDIMCFENDELNLTFVPTFYVSTIYWQEATTLYPTGNLTNIDILAYRITSPGGPMHIGGGVYGSNDNLTTSLKDARVYVKSGNIYKACSISNSGGMYRDDSLPSGSYNLICDRMGYDPVYRSVTLSNFSNDTVNFYMNFHIIGIIKEETNIPVSYWLGNNYPNPFNPVSKIKFGLPKMSSVKLTVYDILGRKSAILLEGEMQAGSYTVEWDASAFSSGVYFYRLETEGFTETKKMLLIK